MVFFFHLRLDKRLSKQSWGWLFETPSRSLWRHCNVPYLCQECGIDITAFDCIYCQNNEDSKPCHNAFFLSYQAMFSLVNPYIYGNQRGKSIQSSVTQFRVRNCDVTDQKRRRRRREVDAGVDNATDDTNATDIMVTQVGPRLTNGFSIAIQIRWKFCFTLTSTLIRWSLQNFVHGTTAVLSWHVQKCVAVWWLATELQQGEVSIEFALWIKIVSETGPCTPSPNTYGINTLCMRYIQSNM